ncbi:VPS52 protein, partial [Herpetotheres cachinnans]|nr:VPS52 protein [Herpetotheres cachinnans]
VHIQANLEDALVQEALKTGVDLRQYSKQVELELQEVERASIRDYIKESENIASLHNQITACDAILERMEQMLSAFQCDLSSISSEIRTLQEQSVAMNLRLKNRRAVRRQLGQLLDELVVPAAMISTILEVPVTEPEFLEQLQELNGKINSVKEQAFRETVACADVQHVLEKLKIKAVTKIREFVLQKIYSFRKPMTNYQIPQNALLKYRFFYQFLLGNERAVAQELREQYVDTMSKIYLSYFKSYTSRLMKIQITRRYAEFSSAIVSINQTFPNEKTHALLGQLQVLGRGGAPPHFGEGTQEYWGPPHTPPCPVAPQVEVENFVLRVAAEFSSRKEQLIFLINNYDMMLGVLMERAVEESKEVEGFQQLLSARTQEFIEEILSPPFGGMIAFVKEAEALLEKGQLERLRGEEARVTQLARGFSSTWKTSVESLSQDVMRSFSNFKNGTGIIQGALTQLIQYYHRFHKVLAQPPLRSLPARAELINIHHLMVELKKHKPNF